MKRMAGELPIKPMLLRARLGAARKRGGIVGMFCKYAISSESEDFAQVITRAMLPQS